MFNCSQEHLKLMSLTALSAETLPFTDKSVTDLLKRLPDALIFEPCHRLRPPILCLSCLFSQGGNHD